jgi:non-specific serine/threonine protein kinase
VVHGCLCNEPPLPATFRVLVDRMPSIASVAATVQAHFGQSYSVEFLAAIGHALAIQPGDRPQHVDTFAQEMRLNPPGDMLKFDWRAELGAAFQDRPVTAAAPSAPTVAATDVELTVSQPGAGGRGIAAGGSRKRRWAGLALVASLLAAGWLVWSWRAGPAPPNAGPGPAHAVPTTAVRPPAPSSAADSSQAGPLALCANRSFLTRPLCIHRACQKPQFAQSAVCLQERDRAARQRERVGP